MLLEYKRTSQMGGPEAYGFNQILTRTKRLDGFRQSRFKQLGLLGGKTAQVRRRRRGRQHQQQGNHREAKPRDASRHQHMVSIENIQAEHIESDMLQRLDVLENCQREEEEEDGQRSQNSQRHIQGAMKLLPRSAVRTLGKMLFVVLAHLRRDA